MTPFFLLISILILLLVPLTLAVLGIQRGLEGELIIFSGWGDFVLTCILVASALFSIPWVFGSADNTPPVCVLNGINAMLWSCITWKNTHKLSELWFSVPAKLILVTAAILGTLFAISCTGKAMKDNETDKERLMNGALAVGAAAGVVKAMDFVRRLIEQAPVTAKSSNPV